jgi:hypothetical protein
MNLAQTIAVLFSLQTFSVTAAVTGGTFGSITPTSSSSYGSPVTFTITPNSGYTLNTLTDNGANVTATPVGNGSYCYTKSHNCCTHDMPLRCSRPKIGTLRASVMCRLHAWGKPVILSARRFSHD